MLSSNVCPIISTASIDQLDGMQTQFACTAKAPKNAPSASVLQGIKLYAASTLTFFTHVLTILPY